MVAIPARCTSCGHTFQPQSGIFIESSTHVTMSNNTTICPRCGGRAKFIEGRFNVTDGAIELLSGPQWSFDLVEGLRLTLRRIVDERPADPVAAVGVVAPVLASDIDRVTRGWSWERKIALIGGILGILGYVGITPENAVEHAPGLMQQVAELLREAAKTGPQS